MYEFPHILRNNLRLKSSGNEETLAQSQNCMEQDPAKMNFWLWHSKSTQKKTSKIFGPA